MAKLPNPSRRVVSGKDDEAVQAALNLIEENYSEKNEQDSRNEKIQELFKEGFEVRDPSGTRKIGSKKLYQAMWRTQNRMKALDFSIHGTGRPEWAEKIVSEGVATVMTNGGYGGSLRDKNGAFSKLLMYGDGFVHVGAAEKGGVIQFRPVDNSNVYVDAYATAIRSETGSGEASKCCVVFSYPWDKAIQLFPKLEKEGGLGEIPRQNVNEKELSRTYEQEVELDDMVEIAYFYDTSNKTYVIFAGGECTILEKMEGKEYPFLVEGEPYIPVLHYTGMPSSEGFYNHGIGAMIYDLAIVSRRLLNMEVNHIEDNVLPVTLINTPKGKASEFFKKLKVAHDMRAAGKKAYVSMEYDSNNPNSSGVNANSLLTNNLVSEWQMIYDMLDRELQRMGIFLDEADRGANVTATQILAEEESSNSFVKQIMEFNASESKFAVELTMDMIKKFVTKGNKTILNLTTTVDIGDFQIRPDNVTLGQVKDEINKFNYFVKINARTGAIPSNVLQQAQVSRVLQLTPPGTPAYFKLMQQFSSLNDRDMNIEDFGGGQPQEGAPQAGGEIEGGAIPSETDRLQLDVRNPQEAPVL